MLFQENSSQIAKTLIIHVLDQCLMDVFAIGAYHNHAYRHRLQYNTMMQVTVGEIYQKGIMHKISCCLVLSVVNGFKYHTDHIMKYSGTYALFWHINSETHKVITVTTLSLPGYTKIVFTTSYTVGPEEIVTMRTYGFIECIHVIMSWVIGSGHEGGPVLYCYQWPLLLTWFNFNPSMDN